MTPGIETLVFSRSEGVFTSTVIIAENTHIQHKNILELIRKHLSDFEDFGRVAFETLPFETNGGTQQREIALLNEQQATLILTYMRNTEIVRNFKKNLVKAFYALINKSAMALAGYDYAMDVARARKLEIEARLISSCRAIATKSFRKKQEQDVAFSNLCQLHVGYCPFERSKISFLYNNSQVSIFENFLSECCVVGKGRIDKKVLFSVFQNYQAKALKGDELYSFNSFCKLMVQHGFAEGRIGNGARFWKGIEPKSKELTRVELGYGK